MSNRLIYLDSLRGYAAIFVLIGHYWGSYGYPEFIEPIRHSPLGFIYHGAGAVAIFFVLSGFVLSKSFLSKPENIERLTFANYSVKRFFRIYPLFLFGLLVSFVLVNLNLDEIQTIPIELERSKRLWSDTYSIKRLILESNLFVYFPKDGGLRLLPQDWTLSIELLISMFIPFFTIILRKKPVSFICLGLFLLYFKVIHVYFFGFFLGMILAYYHKELISRFSKTNTIIKILFFSVGLCFYTSSLWIPIDVLKKLEYLVFEPQTFGAALILITLLVSTRFQKALSGRIIAFIGEISYGIYLTHYFILLGVLPYFFQLLNSIGLDSFLLNNVLGLIFLLGLTILVSFFTYKFVELPGIKVGKYFSKYFDKRFKN